MASSDINGISSVLAGVNWCSIQSYRDAASQGSKKRGCHLSGESHQMDVKDPNSCKSKALRLVPNTTRSGYRGCKNLRPVKQYENMRI